MINTIKANGKECRIINRAIGRIIGYRGNLVDVDCLRKGNRFSLELTIDDLINETGNPSLLFDYIGVVYTIDEGDGRYGLKMRIPKQRISSSEIPPKIERVELSTSVAIAVASSYY